MKHRPRKRFSQNFLQSQTIIHSIIQALNLKTDDKVIEIGPGLGALTRPLLNQLKHITAIEIDNDLRASLTSLPKAGQTLDVISADALTVDYSQWGTSIRVVGNLPYNISTPLLFHLLNFTSHIKDMHFMLQKEVVERLAASPGNKNFGRLSVMIQYYCEVTPLLNVPPEAFHPAPKVHSAVVRLTPYRDNPFPKAAFHELERIAAKAFGMRRKTLLNNLKSLLSAEELTALGIQPQARPEQITVHDYAKLAGFLSKKSRIV